MPIGSTSVWDMAEETTEQDTVENPVEVYQGEFVSDLKMLVTQYIEEFFGDKMMYCGGKIPKKFLHCPKRLSMVMNYNILKGVDRAYESLAENISSEAVQKARMSGDATWDIRLVNETLKMLSQARIPRQFAGGMMCMYLELVEGVDIGF